MKKRSKRNLLTVLSVLFTGSVLAQGSGTAGITETTTMVTSYFEPTTKLIYAIGAIVG